MMIFAAVLLDIPTVTLLAGLVVLVRMSCPICTLQSSVQQLFGVLPTFTALRELKTDLGAPAPITHATGARSAPGGTIRFERVTLRYPGAAVPVFTGLDLWQALAQAGATDLVTAMPQGLHTRMGRSRHAAVGRRAPADRTRPRAASRSPPADPRRMRSTSRPNGR